jgi:pyridoxal phosphate enzyme (YggS family)
MLDPAENYRRIREALPPQVAMVVAAKGRTAGEIARVVDAGAAAIGENYVQEAQRHRGALREGAQTVEWHMIGHLQRNKVGPALAHFDVIQGVDSLRLAGALARRAERTVRVLVEVNIAGEQSKHGILPDALDELLRGMSRMDNLRVEGLMTMEPYFQDPEKARPYFRRMRGLFQQAAGWELPNAAMDVLSMGMTGSYRVAVEEGATMVRLGTAIFGPRPR